jgi:hypothetical protein
MNLMIDFRVLIICIAFGEWRMVFLILAFTAL